MGTGTSERNEEGGGKGTSVYGMLAYEGAEASLRGLTQIINEFFYKFDEYIASTNVTWRNDPEQANEPAEILEAILRLIQLRLQFENDFRLRFGWVQEAEVSQKLDSHRDALAKDLGGATWQALQPFVRSAAEREAFKRFEQAWELVIARHRQMSWRTPLPKEKSPMDEPSTFNFEDED